MEKQILCLRISKVVATVVLLGLGDLIVQMNEVWFWVYLSMRAFHWLCTARYFYQNIQSLGTVGRWILQKPGDFHVHVNLALVSTRLAIESRPLFRRNLRRWAMGDFCEILARGSLVRRLCPDECNICEVVSIIGKRD